MYMYYYLCSCSSSIHLYMCSQRGGRWWSRGEGGWEGGPTWSSQQRACCYWSFLHCCLPVSRKRTIITTFTSQGIATTDLHEIHMHSECNYTHSLWEKRCFNWFKVVLPWSVDISIYCDIKIRDLFLMDFFSLLSLKLIYYCCSGVHIVYRDMWNCISWQH